MEQKRFLMSQREHQRYQVISKTIEEDDEYGGGSSGVRAQSTAGIQAESEGNGLGPTGLIHGNRGRSPATTKPEELMHKVKQLYQGVYRGFNVSHFTEKLTEVEGMPTSQRH